MEGQEKNNKLTGLKKGYNNCVQWLKKRPYIKYIVCIVLLIVLPLIFDDSNVFVMFKNQRRILTIEKEIRQKQKQFSADSLKLEEIRANKGGVEHTARELYNMKKPNETIFLVKDSTEIEADEQ